MHMAVGWHDIHWGDAPTWIAAVGTAGALLLGFYILLRDRRKEERNQASRLGCFKVDRATGGQPPNQVIQAILYLHNASEQMISQPVFFALPKDPNLQAHSAVLPPYRSSGSSGSSMPRIPVPIDVRQETWQLLPGESVQMEITLDADTPNYDFIVQFNDALNQRWVRDVVTQELRREPPPWTYRMKLRYRKLRRKLPGAKP